MVKNESNKTFWETGNGRDFLEWAKIDRLNLESNFDPELFYKYDHNLDLLTTEWLQNGEYKNIMKSLHSNIINEKLPNSFLEFKNKLEKVPTWVDFELIREGCNLSERSGLTGLLILRNFALLGGYNFANLTKPLIATGSLEKGSLHRLYNTLNFWVNVSRSKEDNKIRIDACLQTRLVHAVSRLTILDKDLNWNQEKYGIPINHADMIATNTAFTVYFLYGLQKLNLKYSEQEELGIFHLWKYVTYLLGVPQNLIPNNKNEALQFFSFWTQYQAEADQDARKLAKSLLMESTPISLLQLDFVKQNMDFIHRTVANYLIDDATLKNLNIPEARLGTAIIQAMKLKNALVLNKEKANSLGEQQQKSVLIDYKTNSILQKKAN